MFFVLGVIAGLAGFVPLVAGLKAIKHVTETSNLSYSSILVLSVVGSSIVLFGAAGLCIAFNRENVLFFVAGEAVGIVVVAIAFGIYQVFFRSRGKGS